MVKIKCSRKFVSLSDFWVSSNGRVSDFCTGTWQRGETAVPLLAVRVVLAALALAVLAWALAEGAGPHWLIYLTNWGLLLVTLMMLAGVGISIMAVCNKIPEPEGGDGDGGGELPWYVSTYWVLYNVAVSVALMITALYWILLYDSEAMSAEPARAFWLDVATHALNSCVALAEVAASRAPVRLAHAWQPLAAGLWYAAFTGAYYAAGGTDPNGSPFIYEILDWRHGRRSAAVVAASAAGLLLLYALVWGAALCRDRAAAALRTTSVRLGPAPPDPHMPSDVV